MKHLQKFAAVSIATVALTLGACSERVEIPPAHKGKILTKNGYKPETVSPSKFRLDWCWWYCDKLVLLEASDVGMKETFRLFMPKDQLNMSFDVRFTMSVRDEQKAIDSIFARIPPSRGKANHQVISTQQIYLTYGQPVLREVARTVMANYSINQVASSREAVSAELVAAIKKALQKTPLTVKRAALADVQFPDVITQQKEAAARRRIEIEEQEAKKQIALVRLQTELETAKMERAIRRVRAEAAREENAIYAESVNPDYLAYRRLEVLMAMANNSNTVFMPFKALDEVGLSQRIFTKSEKKGE